MSFGILAVAVPLVFGHGSMIMPPTRNAIDSETAAWSNGQHPMTGTIEPYNCRCTNASEPECNSGQSCFWFSQGCSIGCSACDGNASRIPNWDHCPHESINLTDPSRLLKQYWTANQDALVGSVQDVFKWNPWRAPGKAPVFDPCGMAGGIDHEVFNAAAYNTTIYAKQGDLGTVVLKPRQTGTIWTRGTNVKVRWQQTADHGGGYQYRLCPASEPLTEACFQANPLQFATPAKHTLRFADPSKDMVIPATVVTAGGGIGWMRYPIPPHFKVCDYVTQPGEHCSWKCPGCGPPKYAADSACPAPCPEHYPGTPADVSAVPSIFPDPAPGIDYHSYAIEDTVHVPANIPAGEYVVGWRWDAEQTTQVWQSCADIIVV